MYSTLYAASPGPLPMTPNGPGGSSVFNFCSPPMISPAKPIRSMGAVLTGNVTSKPGPLSMPNSDASMQGIGTLNYQQTAMLAGIACIPYGVHKHSPVIHVALHSVYFDDNHYKRSQTFSSHCVGTI